MITGEQLRLPADLMPAPVDLCGCHPSASPDVLIAAMAARGLRASAIAHRLNVAGVPTGSGRGRWYGETVQRRVDRAGWNAYMRAYRARQRR
jgi:hypothetical protein